MIDASTAPVASAMTSRLTAALSPTRLELEDQSAHHIGHDPRGESHFALTIESPAFDGQSHLARQRMVYAALGDLMLHRVHASPSARWRRNEATHSDRVRPAQE